MRMISNQIQVIVEFLKRKRKFLNKLLVQVDQVVHMVKEYLEIHLVELEELDNNNPS